jgi:FdhE protein
MAARDGARREVSTPGGGSPPPVPGGVVRARIGDPTQGVHQLPPIILPEPAGVFARRAARLDVLAEGHPMSDWLRFMAALARAQEAAVSLQRPPLVPAEVLAQARDGGAPPFPAETAARDRSWREGLREILARVDARVLPDQAREVVAALRGRGDEALERLADAALAGHVPAGEAGAALFVVAALQVHFAVVAAALPVAALALLPQRGRCPVCGSAPAVGMISASGAAGGARYLHCGLCATAWNHVRAVCIRCGEAKALVLEAIAGESGLAKGETCGLCRGYAKMLYQTEDMQADPVADDLATLGLDLLLAEAGWARHAPNPLIIGG